jgi:hypothetical protein
MRLLDFFRTIYTPNSDRTSTGHLLIEVAFRFVIAFHSMTVIRTLYTFPSDVLGSMFCDVVRVVALDSRLHQQAACRLQGVCFRSEQVPLVLGCWSAWTAASLRRLLATLPRLWVPISTHDVPHDCGITEGSATGEPRQLPARIPTGGLRVLYPVLFLAYARLSW